MIISTKYLYFEKRKSQKKKTFWYKMKEYFTNLF